jgi:uncharacterized membrane protein
MSRTALYVIFGLIIVLFVITIAGQFTSGSQRWVEPAESAGWICFVVLVMGEYLLNRGPGLEGTGYSSLEKAAWACGGLSIALLAVSIIAFAASAVEKTWMEAVQLGGLLFMLGLVILSVYSRKLRDGEAG